jgi:hypothetical protein
MSDTPRTDKNSFPIISCTFNPEKAQVLSVTFVEFARGLEREVAELEEKIKELTEIIDKNKILVKGE